MTNFRDLLKQAKSEVGATTPEEVERRLKRATRLEVLDVRENEEVRTARARGPTRSRSSLREPVEDVLTDKDAEVVVYCASGVRSVFATRRSRSWAIRTSPR